MEDDFVKIGEFIGGAVDVAAEVPLFLVSLLQ